MLTPSDESDRPAPLRLGALLFIPLLLAGGLALLIIGRTSVDDDAAVVAPRSDAAQSVSVSGGADREEIENIVKEYLLGNPELLLEVQSALEAKMEKEQAEKIKAAIAKNANDIFRHPEAPIAGNPAGDITVVEFFDYNCGYCKKSFGDVARLIDEDSNVRVVFKEFPILSEGSEKAARVALAARMQGKYWELHRELISSRGPATEATALDAAGKLGLDLDKLKSDMASDSVTRELDRVKTLAQDLGVNGTPHFLVGNRSIGGAPSDLFEQLVGHVKDMRTAGCSYC